MDEKIDVGAMVALLGDVSQFGLARGDVGVVDESPIPGIFHVRFSRPNGDVLAHNIPSYHLAVVHEVVESAEGLKAAQALPNPRRAG